MQESPKTETIVIPAYYLSHMKFLAPSASAGIGMALIVFAATLGKVLAWVF